MPTIICEIKKINAFIKQPAEFFLERLTKKDKIRVFVVAILYKALFAAVVLAILYIVEKHLFVLQMPLLNMQLWTTFLFAVVVAPLFEELIFRLPLRYDRSWIWRKMEGILSMEPGIFWTRNYKYILYMSVLMFGLIHLTNYGNKEFLFYLIAPVIVGSQLFGGLVLSYIRLKLGFWWSFAQHGLWNGSIIVLSLILFHNKEVVHISQKGFTLSMHELAYLDKKEQKIVISRLENGSINSLEVKNSSVQQLIDSLYTKNRFVVLSDSWMNLTLRAPEGLDKRMLLDVLKKHYRIKSLIND